MNVSCTRRTLSALLSLLLLASTACTASTPRTSTGQVPQAATAKAVDSDGDGLPDELEKRVGTDPKDLDTDDDGLSDGFELIEMPKRATKQTAVPAPWGVATAYAAEAPNRHPWTDPGAWKAVDPSKLFDSDKDGVHDAQDAYANGIEVTLTVADVQRVHSSITASWGWDWDTDIPKAKDYNDYFVALLKNDTKTPCAQVDTAATRIVPPDLTDPLTEDKAVQAWVGRTYQAKIPVWKLDDLEHGGDGDGIPNGYETYGYSWDGSKLVPWGFTLSGNSAYTAPTVGFEIVGTKLTPKSATDIDYTVQYFKTDHSQFSSDADPYSDKLESSHANIPQAVKAPADRPSVAAYPSIVGYMDQANVTLKQTITTRNGTTIKSGTASGGIKQASNLPGISVSKFVMGKHRPQTGIAAKGLDFLDKQAVSAAYSQISPEPAVTSKFPDLALNAAFQTKTEDWSQTVTQQTDQAADLDFEAVVVNTGFANASQVTPTFEVLLADKVLGQVTAQTPIAQIDAQGKPASFHTGKLNMSLDDLKTYQSGAPVSLRLQQADASLMIPVRNGDSLTYQDGGKWSPFSSAIDNACARLTVDMGNGTFATYPVAVNGGTTTLLDALLWTLGTYKNGSFQSLDVPGFMPGVGSSMSVPSFKDWMFCFDEHYPASQVEASGTTLFGIPLVPGSHIYARSPLATGTRPAVPWTTVSSTSGMADDITNTQPKTVRAGVNADMAVADVWLAPSADAARSSWTALSDADGDGIWTASLPASARVVAGKTVVIAEAAARWGDGQEGSQTAVPVKTTGATGVKGRIASPGCTSFPKHNLGLPKQILCFDVDGGSASVQSHSSWDRPPSGTDLSIWLYSTARTDINGSTIIDYHGFVEAYGSPKTPGWAAGDSKWDGIDASHSVAVVAKKSGVGGWTDQGGGIQEEAVTRTFNPGDTVFFQFGDGRWAKWTITDLGWDKTSKADGTAYDLKNVTADYTIYDAGQ